MWESIQELEDLKIVRDWLLDNNKSVERIEYLIENNKWPLYLEVEYFLYFFCNSNKFKNSIDKSNEVDMENEFFNYPNNYYSHTKGYKCPWEVIKYFCEYQRTD